MPEPFIGWRDKIALWCLRVLTPNGICAENVPVRLHFHSGQSPPEDPKLVMGLKYDKTGQTIVAVVFDPDTVVDVFTEAVDGLRDWSKSMADHG